MRSGALDKVERERAAADRLFGLLPPDQGQEFRALWDEFESRQTIESRVRFGSGPFHTPTAQLSHAGKKLEGAWHHRGSCARRGTPASLTAPALLWEWAEALLNDAVDKGFLQLLKENQAVGARNLTCYPSLGYRSSHFSLLF